MLERWSGKGAAATLLPYPTIQFLSPTHFICQYQEATPLRASSAQTQKKLGWHPIGPGLIADLEQMSYS